MLEAVEAAVGDQGLGLRGAESLNGGGQVLQQGPQSFKGPRTAEEW